MEIIASDLKLALDGLNSVVSSKGMVEDCDKFVFDKKGIFAFNGENFIAVKFESDISGAVPGETFYKIIDKHGTSKIEIDVDGDCLIVKKGRSKSSFPFDVDVKCPISLEVKKWKDLPTNFLEALNTCSYTTGKDYTDMRTVCIHMKGDVAESSDSFRMTLVKLASKIKDDLFIPNDALKFFNKCKPVQYSKTKDWIYYKDLNGTIICHRGIVFSQEYPDLKAMVESQEGYQQLEFPEKLYDSLEKASVFLDKEVDQDRYVSISCKGGKLKISSKSTSGKYLEVLKVGFDNTIEFDIHPSYMMEAIERSSTVSINDATIKISSATCTNLICLTDTDEPEVEPEK